MADGFKLGGFTAPKYVRVGFGNQIGVPWAGCGHKGGFSKKTLVWNEHKGKRRNETKVAQPRYSSLFFLAAVNKTKINKTVRE